MTDVSDGHVLACKHEIIQENNRHIILLDVTRTSGGVDKL